MLRICIRNVQVVILVLAAASVSPSTKTQVVNPTVVAVDRVLALGSDSESRLRKALGKCEQEAGTLLLHYFSVSKFTDSVKKICKNQHLKSNECYAYFSACQQRLDASGAHAATQMTGLYQKVIGKMKFDPSTDYRVWNTSDWMEATKRSRGRPWSPPSGDKVDSLNGNVQKYEQEFKAMRDGRRIVLAQKMKHLEGGSTEAAKHVSFIDTMEEQAWQRFWNEGIISRGNVGAPSRFCNQGNVFATSVFKLTHDAEQLSLLLVQGKLPRVFWKLVHSYLDIAFRHQSYGQEGPFILSAAELDVIGGYYQTFMYHPSFQSSPAASVPATVLSLTAGKKGKSDTLNAAFQMQKYIVIDDFFTPEALEHLVTLCNEATIFFDVNDGYLGAYHFEGLMDSVLVKLIEELREQFPTIIGDQRLINMWAYKYSDDGKKGIRIHGDDAQVSINIWLNPVMHDNMKGGGLTFWKQETGLKWSFEDMQHSENLMDMVSDREKFTVPFRTNRAVMFKSRLLHQTEEFDFPLPGYKHRRINLTLMFGERKPTGKKKQEKSEL